MPHHHYLLEGLKMNEIQKKETTLHFLDYWRVIRARKEIVLAVLFLVVITGTAYTPCTRAPRGAEKVSGILRASTPTTGTHSRRPESAARAESAAAAGGAEPGAGATAAETGVGAPGAESGRTAVDSTRAGTGAHAPSATAPQSPAVPATRLTTEGRSASKPAAA
jgi:hypothetical protein